MMQTWKVGEARVTRIGESIDVSDWTPEQFIRDFDRAVFERHLPYMPGQYAADRHRLVSSIHTWLIRTGRHTILVDTCCGNHKPRPWMRRFNQLDTPWLAQLADAGVQPEDVDFVLCTHLHADHVGWNTRLENGRWVPTFPNARYLFSDLDDRRFNPARNPAVEPDRAIIYGDSVLPVVESGQAQLIDGVHAIDDGLRIEPSPGHTPGHVILKLSDAGRHGLFAGDTLHHVIQVFFPDWNSSFCLDQAAARSTRRRILEFCADHDALLFPTHFGAPHVVRVERSADAFVPHFVQADAPPTGA